MKNHFIIYIVVLLLGAASAVSAQNRTIKGQVLDSQGKPLIGATVNPSGVKGTGTVTDIEGNFSLLVPASVKQVEVSYIGYLNQKVNVTNGKVNTIYMTEDNHTLNDVVVIGYGSVKKGDVTAAVAQIKGDQLSDRPVANIASALQGELAGVDVQSTSGAPGSGVQIKVRGATTINESGSTDPLYVIDGVPMDDNFDLEDLNPQDIASIEVLKDASSSAIYGSRGANGVIIITSKKGTDDGKTNINASVNFAVSTPERYLPVMSSSEWMAWRSRNNYENYIETYGAAGAQVGDTYAQQVTTTQGGASTSVVNDPRWSMPGYGGLNLVDWQKAMFKPSLSENVNMSISQGNETTNYRASVGFVNQDGIVIKTGFKRLNVNLFAQTTVRNKLTLGINVAPQMTVTKGGDVDGKDNTAMASLSMVPVTENEAGLYSGAEPYDRYIYAGSTVSPVAVMEQRSYRDEQVRINSSAFADYQFNKSWKAEVLGSWIFFNRTRNVFTPSTVNRSWASGEGYYATARWTGSRSHKFMIQATTTYDHTWAKKHHLNFVAGWSLESSQDASSYEMDATQFPNNTIQGFTINDVTLTAATATYPTDDHLISYFARAEYGYDSRYLINASLRKDGSSRFGTNRKWGTFPAVSAAWRVSNEKFWNEKWWMNQAKLRFSYGTNGSNSIPANSADGKLTTSYYSEGGSVTTGYIPNSTDNPDLGWQKTYSWDVGVDMSFFSNRISFAVDYYLKNISDMLYQQTLPSVIGYSTGYTNIGNIRTQGLELELKTENLTGKLRWTTSASVGHTTNKVTSLGDNSAIYMGYNNETQIIQVGHPVGEYYMYIADGIYKTEEDLKKYPVESTSAVGCVRYHDVNGDGKIDENDRTYVGRPDPAWTFGLTNTFTWKNWDASILFTAQLGGNIWSALGRAIDMQSQSSAANRLKSWLGQWYSETDTGNGIVPRSTGSVAEQFSTRWLYSTDFVKLKNITIGYHFRFPKTAFVQQLRLTASIENLFMIDGYDNGYSPESNNTGSVLRAYDYGAYPLARTFSIGANIQF